MTNTIPAPRTFTVHFNTHALALSIGRSPHEYSCNLLEELLRTQLPRHAYPDVNLFNGGLSREASRWMQCQYEQHLPHVRLSRATPTAFVFSVKGPTTPAAMELWMEHRVALAGALLGEPDRRIELAGMVPYYFDQACDTSPNPKEN
jgi:hypothetical protein